MTPMGFALPGGCQARISGVTSLMTSSSIFWLSLSCNSIASAGVIYGTFSRYIPRTTAETVIEVNYQITFNRWLAITPDMQYVIRPNPDFRGYAGRVDSGSVRVGGHVTVLPSGKRSRVKRIVTFDGDLEEDLATTGVEVV